MAPSLRALVSRRGPRRGTRCVGGARAAGRRIRGLAGASPEAGSRPRSLPGVLYAIFGTCRELDVGPSSTIAITAAAVLVPVAASFPDLQYAALLAGFALLTGCAHRGRRTSSRAGRGVPRPPGGDRVHQRDRCRDRRRAAAEALGLTVESGNVPETLWRTIEAPGEHRLGTPVVGCTSLAALLVLRRVAPRVPWALIVGAVSIACSRAFDFPAHGIAVIADVPAGLPTPAWPAIGLGEVGPSAAGHSLWRSSRWPSRSARRARWRRKGGTRSTRIRSCRARRLQRRGRAAAGIPGRRQPLPQRRRGGGRGAFAAVGSRRRGAHRRHDALSHPPVRRATSGDARRHHHRRGYRPRGRSRSSVSSGGSTTATRSLPSSASPPFASWVSCPASSSPFSLSAGLDPARLRLG